MLSLLNNKYVLYMLLFSAYTFGVYNFGYSSAKDKALIAKQDVEIKEADLANNIDNNASIIATELAKEKSEAETKEKEIIEEVIQYVQKPDRNVYTFDDDWLRIRQSILNNVDTRNKPID